jgi:hypothetical protein
MIKQEIRSLVRQSLPKVDKANRWHDNFLNAAIEKAVNSLYHDVFLTAPLSLQNYSKGYGYTIPIAIATESSTGIKYCTLL